MKKLFLPILGALGLVVGLAGPAFAHDCVNLSMNPKAVQVVINVCSPDDPIFIGNGVVQHLTHAQVANFHGPVGIDVNCDNIADVISYEPGQGTGGVIPGAENPNKQNIAQCKGMTNFDAAADAGCLGG